METGDIFIDDNLFDDTNQKDIKKISEDVVQNTNLDQNEAFFVDLLKEQPEKVKITTKKIPPKMAANRIKKNIKGKDKLKDD